MDLTNEKVFKFLTFEWAFSSLKILAPAIRILHEAAVVISFLCELKIIFSLFKDSAENRKRKVL